MDALLNVLTVLVIALLWVAAIVFGRDSRQGSDWISRSAISDRPQRIGD
jgi:hypothetical protein